MEFLAALVAGLTVGSIYALMAVSINIVFAARRVVNFALGDQAMLAGLVAASLIASFSWPYFFGLLVVVVLAALIGIAIERLAMRPLSNDENSISWILSILAVALILGNVAQIFYGTDPRRMPALIAGEVTRIGSVPIFAEQLIIIGAAGLCMMAFHLLQTHTRHGKAMQAVAQDPAMASLLGIHVQRYIAGAFALSGILAAVAAVLIGPLTFVGAALGFTLGIKGFAAAALGGLGTFRGAVLGGLLLGIGETFAALYISSASKDSVALLALAALLILRPAGLLGQARITKM